MSAPKNDMADIAGMRGAIPFRYGLRCSERTRSTIMTSAMTTATNAGIVMPVISAAASKSKRTMARLRVDEHGVRGGEEEQDVASAPRSRARGAFGR